MAAATQPESIACGHWDKWHADHESDHEWHASYAAVRPFLAPYLTRALSGEAAGAAPLIVDVGCGTSTWGQELLAEWPAAQLCLVDAVAPLMEQLRERHASDPRIRCLVGDCRKLEALGVGRGSVAVVLDKGTLDALSEPEDQAAMLRGAAGLLAPAGGAILSVSFATATRVLLLRRLARELGLALRLRVVPVEPEARLVAVLSRGFGDIAEEPDALTEQRLDSLLYAGPLRTEHLITFAHEAMSAAVVVEQQQPGVRAPSDDDATGNVVWPSAHALSTHLCLHPELVRGLRVAELGAGTGLVGLVAAALGAREVLLTDLPSTLPLLDANVGRNAAATEGCRTSTAELRWGADAAATAGECDLVIGCEIVYQHDEETSAALVDTMAVLCGAKGVCLMAYEFRDGLVEDMHFFDAVNERFEVEVVPLDPYGFGASRGADESSRLLYVYRPK